ncbi:hypothetical protein E4U32_002284 [Claviceps aff. humidiphila group G2b]|nr:hypothetical protein E4U32_002284 [Claviceps aff. humidiphila group G2b]
MKLSTAASFSMAVVPALADDPQDYILTCARDMYRGADAQGYFSTFYTNTCYYSDCDTVELPQLGDSVVSGGCTGCPMKLDLNNIPYCLMAPIPS